MNSIKDKGKTIGACQARAASTPEIECVKNEKDLEGEIEKVEHDAHISLFVICRFVSAFLSRFLARHSLPLVLLIYSG